MTTLLDASLDDGFIKLISTPVPDPRPFYARLRSEAPAFRTTLGFWYVTRYDLAMEIIRNPRGWVNHPIVTDGEGAPRRSYGLDLWNRAFMYLDGQDHKHMRGLVGELATPRFVNDLHTAVESTVDDLLAVLDGRVEFDFKHDFADLLPTKVIMRILGLDEAELPRLLGVAQSIASMLEPLATDATIAEGDARWRAAAEVVLDTVAKRRDSPADDLLSRLVKKVDAENLPDEDLLSLVFFLAVAGHETTANMLSNGLYHLLTRPGMIAELRGNADLLPSAVEELLRYEAPPRNSVARYAVEDARIGDELIRRGESVYVGYHAANHDPAVFPDPLTLDIRRTPNRHIAFGVGVHHCLGAALSRLELRLGYAGLLRRYSQIELAGSPAWLPGFVIRGLDGLPVRVVAK
jgi:pimeloyl-[acyl-carrier protein] synthase